MKNWPIYYKDVLYKANPKSNVGICTLWTPKDPICDRLNQNGFNLGGQLYSKDYYVKGDDTCQIQEEIELKAIEDFRKNVNVVDMRGDIDPNEIEKKRKSVEMKSPKSWAKKSIFKESEFQAGEKFPSEKSTFTIRSDYIWESWVQVLRLLMKFGSKKGMIKIGEVKELVNVITVIEKENPNKPELSEAFDFKKKDLEIYYKDFFAKDKGSESYNYGERLYAYPVGLPVHPYNAARNEKLFRKDITHKSPARNATHSVAGGELITKVGLDQLEEMYEKYARYHEDRGMVAALWNPWVDNVKEGWMADNNSKLIKDKKITTDAGNVPCMVLLQFTYRSKKLHLTAYFRSNDMFDAWPRNAFALRKLQYDFAKRIGKKPGYLTTISNCAQVYETNYEEADKIITKYKDRTFCRQDPRSTIIVEVVGEEIVARQMSVDGNEQLDEYRVNGTKFKAALKLMDILLINEVFSDKYQIADISIELTKAEWCIKNKKRFIQDRDLDELKMKD